MIFSKPVAHTSCSQKVSQYGPPWICEDRNSPFWPLSTLDTSQIKPQSGGSFWSCYNKSIVVTMTWWGHKLSLQRSLVCTRKVELLRGTPWLTTKLKRSWALENENESRKKESEPHFSFLLLLVFVRGKLNIFAFIHILLYCSYSCVVNWTYLRLYRYL